MRDGIRGVSRGWRGALAGALLACLVACVGSSSPPDRFFRLEPAPPPTRFDTPPLAGVLEVGRLRGDAILEGREIHYRPSRDAPEIRSHGYHRWADAPTTMLQLQLARYLRAANAARAVVTPELRVAPDYELSGRLLRLERVLGEGPPRVVVELELALTRTRGREILLSGTYREAREAEGLEVRDAVIAFDAAVTELFSRFVASLGEL